MHLPASMAPASLARGDRGHNAGRGAVMLPVRSSQTPCAAACPSCPLDSQVPQSNPFPTLSSTISLKKLKVFMMQTGWSCSLKGLLKLQKRVKENLV